MFKNICLLIILIYILLSMLQYNILEKIILFNSCSKYNDILNGLYY